MREIKFRAMTKPPEDFGNYHFESVMVYGTGFLKDPVNTWLVSSKENEPIAFGTVKKIIKPETVGQFTGLRDKNEKEVYEGDIVRDEHGLISAIEYSEKEARFGTRTFIFDVNYLTVIGNIHENPELLK